MAFNVFAEVTQDYGEISKMCDMIPGDIQINLKRKSAGFDHHE